MYDITVIGAAILDVLAHPVSASELTGRSWPADGISMTIGGDAANEATTLSRLGKRVHLITKLGNDMTGQLILNHFQEIGVSMEDSVIEDGLNTGINMVLVDKDAERSFITNRNGSLRKLSLQDIPEAAVGKSPVVSFASIFVSPLFDTQAMTALFRRVKDAGCTLCADMTRCKNGETLADIAPALAFTDYLFPNYEEARAVSGLKDTEEIADAFLSRGVSCIVIKLGGKGCFLKNQQTAKLIPAFPGTKCIDTTGAGDNFAAGFLYALSEGMTDTDCALFANAAASVAVESVGACTGITSLAQVEARFRKMKEL